jgi:hypothetical protein
MKIDLRFFATVGRISFPIDKRSTTEATGLNRRSRIGLFKQKHNIYQGLQAKEDHMKESLKEIGLQNGLYLVRATVIE